jgi:hypothetical protein
LFATDMRGISRAVLVVHVAGGGNTEQAQTYDSGGEEGAKRSHSMWYSCVLLRQRNYGQRTLDQCEKHLDLFNRRIFRETFNESGKGLQYQIVSPKLSNLVEGENQQDLDDKSSTAHEKNKQQTNYK